MLQRSLILWAAAASAGGGKEPISTTTANSGVSALPVLQAEYVMSLPLDVLLRRLQSSSSTNPARGLQAHFSVQAAASGDAPPHRSLSSSSSSLSPVGPVRNDGNSDHRLRQPQQRQPSPADLRSALSRRLLVTLGEEEEEQQQQAQSGSSSQLRGRPSSSSSPPSPHQSGARPRRPLPPPPPLSIDEVSLILANALRHDLSAGVVRGSLRQLSERMSDHHRRGGGGGAGPALSPLAKAEALARVLESCVAASEASSATPGGRADDDGGEAGLAALDIDAWASMTGWVAELWAVLAASPSTACLMVQFYALAIARITATNTVRITGDGYSGGNATGVGTTTTATTTTTGGGLGGPLRALGRFSLPSLRTDPALLSEQCYRQCEKALSVLLATDGGGGVGGGGGDDSSAGGGRGTRDGRNRGGSSGRKRSASPRSWTLSRPTELVRLSHSVRQLQWYEAATAATAAAASALPLLSSSSSTLPAAAAAAGLPGVTAAAASAATTSPSPSSSSSSSSATWWWWQSARARRGYITAAAQQLGSSALPGGGGIGGAGGGSPFHLSRLIGAVIADHVTPTVASLHPSGGSLGLSAVASPLLAASRSTTTGMNEARVMTMGQLAAVFSTVADTAPAATVAGLSLHLGEALRRDRERGTSFADPASLAGVVTIGEACLRNSAGTQAVLAEVLRCLLGAAVALVQMGFEARMAGVGGGEPSPCATASSPTGSSPFSSPWLLSSSSSYSPLSTLPAFALWPRACELAEHAPLALRAGADQMLMAFARALLALPLATFAVTPPPTRTPPLSSLLSPYAQREQQQQAPTLLRQAQYRHARYGALLLACQLSQRIGHSDTTTSGSSSNSSIALGSGEDGLSELRERLLALTAEPFSGCRTAGEARLELRSVVRALHIFSTSQSRPPQSQSQSQSSLPLTGGGSGGGVTRYLLQQLSVLLGEGDQPPVSPSQASPLSPQSSPVAVVASAAAAAGGAVVGLETLTAAERTMLRAAVRAARLEAVAVQRANAAAPTTTTTTTTTATTSVASDTVNSGGAKPRGSDPVGRRLADLAMGRTAARTVERTASNSTDSPAVRRAAAQSVPPPAVPTTTTTTAATGKPFSAADAVEDSHQLHRELSLLSRDLHQSFAAR